MRQENDAKIHGTNALGTGKNFREITFQDMAENLTKVDDMAWGLYAFSRDLLRDKVDRDRKEEMIQKAIRCGFETAENVMAQMGTSDTRELACSLGLNVEYLERGQIADRVLFALFTPPDRIQIMKEPIERAVKGGKLEGFITGRQMEDLILGHEIFHYLEEEDENIYTRTEKIRLWKVLGFENRSTIRALSEIAGMYFSKKLNSFPYSPFALDILLYYNYNSETAFQMYREAAGI